MDNRDDPDRAPPRDVRETTIINTGGRGGGGGLVVAIVLLAVAAVVLFVLFGGVLERGGDGLDVNVNVEAPDIDLPDLGSDEAPAKDEAK